MLINISRSPHSAFCLSNNIPFVFYEQSNQNLKAKEEIVSMFNNIQLHCEWKTINHSLMWVIGFSNGVQQRKSMG